MTEHHAAQPATRRAGADSTQKKIQKIQDKYLAPDGDPKKMVSSADVEAAIGDLDERNGLDVSGRCVLARFLENFGGYANDPDRFLPADKAALTAAILKGIDSPAALENQPKPDQAAVLDNLVFTIDSAVHRVGFSVQRWDGLDFNGVTDANARNTLQDAVTNVKPPKGYGPELFTEYTSVARGELNGQPYGYSATATYGSHYFREEEAKVWSTAVLANASGHIVSQASGFSWVPTG
jgi:hypothetical protein